jgi:CspA family cold shock protein
MNGKVKFYNRTKVFGFVAGEDGTEYFMHSTAIEDGYVPDEDDEVTFEAGSSDKGPRASDVKQKQGEAEGLAALDEE